MLPLAVAHRMMFPILLVSEVTKALSRPLPSAAGYSALLVISLCWLLPQLRAQATPTHGLASLTGRVTDAHGHAIAGAIVKVIGDNSGVSAQTDADGKYAISSLSPGTYTLRVEAEKYESTVLAPVTVGSNEVKTIDITLAGKVSTQHTSIGAPEFFDRPQFTIAGVTDTTNLGGHASGMAPPSESLAKDVNLLSENAHTAPSNTAAEEAACALADDPSTLAHWFEENRAAGTLLLEDGKPQKAIRYLLRASNMRSQDYDTSYALARAYVAAGDYAPARTLIQTMLANKKSADLHHLLAVLEEKSGDPLKAEKEYRRAAELNPNETNLFDWGMELLTHHALEPSIEVFKNGNHHFPQSARMLSGLAASFYERGSYDEALQYACAATDLNPRETNPYLLLGKMQDADRGQSDAPLIRLERFASLQPENASANYYYAVALWKRRKGAQDVSTSAHVESLLQKAIHLDPQMAKAYFQLGILHSEKNNLPQAIASYESAVRVDPQLVEAHYRLAQAYVASGQSEKSQQEIALYKEKAKTRAEAAERERREVQQFVYTMQAKPEQ